MKPRKYQNVQVSKGVYVTSQSGYWFHVIVDVVQPDGTVKHRSLDYDPTFGCVNSKGWQLEIPRYFEVAIVRGILARHAEGTLVFYEHDQDGNRRYKHLRYHDAESLASVLGILRRIL